MSIAVATAGQDIRNQANELTMLLNQVYEVRHTACSSTCACASQQCTSQHDKTALCPDFFNRRASAARCVFVCVCVCVSTLQTLTDPDARAIYDMLAGFADETSVNPFDDTSFARDQVFVDECTVSQHHAMYAQQGAKG